MFRTAREHILSLPPKERGICYDDGSNDCLDNKDNNWEGRVDLRIAIGEDGAISSLTVNKGAGRAVLDDEAQAMIRTAKAKATIPPGLRGKAFNLEISVDFFLKDEEK